MFFDKVFFAITSQSGWQRFSSRRFPCSRQGSATLALKAPGFAKPRPNSLLLAMAATLLLAPGTVPASTISLGSAGDYAAAALNGHADFNMSGFSVINGNTYVGSSTGSPSMDFSGGTISGSLYIDPSATITTYSGAIITGHTITLSSTASDQVTTDLNTALTEINGLTATQTYGNLTSTTTITGNGGLNVIDATGINFSSGDELNLNGTVNDYFVVRVSGPINVGSDSELAAGAEGASHVIYVATGSTGNYDLSINSVIYGTLIAATGNMELNGNTVVNGAVLVHGPGEMDLSGYATVNYEPFVSPVPEPSTFALLGALVIAVGGWRAFSGQRERARRAARG
jgi:hypothetical protein